MNERHKKLEEQETTPALFRRYLSILGVQERDPSLDALEELVMAVMIRVPFENLSKLYYMKQYGLFGLPDLKQYLDGIDHYNFGGTCYSNNYFLHLLLTYLGYDVMLCGAAMSDPDVHVVNIVALEGRELLIDTGYAAPFYSPIPLDLKEDHVIALGRDRYVLKPQDGNGSSRVLLLRDGQQKHGYVVKPIPREIGHFDRVIAESFEENATFMNALLLVRLFPNRSIVIHNLSVIQSEGMDYHIHHLTGRDDLPSAVEKHFSIPREIVSEAVAELGEFGDAWN